MLNFIFFSFFQRGFTDNLDLISPENLLGGHARLGHWGNAEPSSASVAGTDTTDCTSV